MNSLMNCVQRKMTNLFKPQQCLFISIEFNDLQDEKSGRITEADASIQLNYDDVEKVGIKLPLRQEDGCIRLLGRYCVLVSTMFFYRVGSYTESARVKS